MPGIDRPGRDRTIVMDDSGEDDTPALRLVDGVLQPFPADALPAHLARCAPAPAVGQVVLYFAHEIAEPMPLAITDVTDTPPGHLARVSGVALKAADGGPATRSVFDVALYPTCGGVGMPRPYCEWPPAAGTAPGLSGRFSRIDPLPEACQ